MMSVRCFAVLASSAIVGLALATPGGVAAATRGAALTPHFATVGTHYAVTKQLCAAAPKPGSAACDAVRLVRVRKTTPGARPYVVKNSFPAGPAGGYTPADLATAYGYNPAAAPPATLPATTQTIGIVDAADDPNILSDLDTFDATYGLPAETATSFVKVGQTGSTTALPAADTTGWSGEESLDVETARGVCNLCNIVLVETSNSSDASLAAGVKTAVALGANEVSNSYGGPENPRWSKAMRAAYKKLYNYPGVVITASTGDDGWFSWDFANDGEPSVQVPNLPATLPTVVAVGGTSLALTARGTRRSERVWNSDGRSDSAALAVGEDLGASGGGCSVLYRAQGWQAKVPGYRKTGCGATRLAADVSADADPATGFDVYDTYDCGRACQPLPSSGWQTVGGTSLSSPLIAGMWALAGGAGGVAYPALSLYGHDIAAVPSLFDVTAGGNSWCDQDPKCAKHTKNETASPRAAGEPNPNHLCLVSKNGKCLKRNRLKALDCGFVRTGAKPTPLADNRQCDAAPGYDGPSGVGTPVGLAAFTALHPSLKIHAPSEVVAGKAATFSSSGHDPFPGGGFATQQWSWGDGRHSTTTRSAKRHLYAAGGTYTVTLTVTDVYGETASKSVTVTVAPAT